MRGEANKTLTASLALQLGMAAGLRLSQETDRRPLVIAARDTRISGEMLEAALAAGFASAGVRVLLAGVAPTPAVSCMVQSLRADAGVVISASHNKFQDNGIKFFGPDGKKLPDATEAQIEALLPELDSAALPTGSAVGAITEDASALQYYLQALRSHMPAEEKPLQGLKLVMDCANGAAWQLAPQLFAELGAELHLMHAEPNGININENCGSTHPEAMAAETAHTGAHAGLSFDGDADRVILADENGRVVDGDRILYLLALALQRRNMLTNQVVTATIMSNVGLEQALQQQGIRLHRTDVGDRYVAEAMQTLDAALGGEQSGHILLPHLAPTGDGLLTALQLLAVMQQTKTPLSQLVAPVQSYPQLLRNVRVKNRDGWREDAEIQQAVEAARKRFDNPQWLSVRPSGTEPILRVMAQGTDEETVQTVVHELCELLQKRLGAAD